MWIVPHLPLSLLEMGYEVIGVTMKLWDGVQPDGGCLALSAVDDARAVANKLKIPYYVLNFTDDFHKYVVNNFIDEYTHGRTPNPCIMCNKHLKFDAMLHKASEMRARIAWRPGITQEWKSRGTGILLKRSADPKKDQTYFLYYHDPVPAFRRRFSLFTALQRTKRGKLLRIWGFP